MADKFLPSAWTASIIDAYKTGFSYRRKSLGEKLLRASAEGSTPEQLKIIEEMHNAPFSFTERAAQALADDFDKYIMDAYSTIFSKSSGKR